MIKKYDKKQKKKMLRMLILLRFSLGTYLPNAFMQIDHLLRHINENFILNKMIVIYSI